MTSANLPNSHPAVSPRGRNRWVVLLGVVLLLSAGAAGGWWWRRHAAPVEPPVISGVQDAEVRQSIEQARQRVLTQPRSAEAWGFLGMILLAHRYDREADRCFEEAGRLNPAQARWPYARGLIALKRDPNHALPFLRRAVACNANPEEHAAIQLQLAEALLERQELDEAERLFREEWQGRPDKARAALGLGLIALARDDPASARKYLTAARTNNYAHKRATVQLAALARANGDLATARTYEQEAAALADDPRWPDPVLDEATQLRVGRRGREREIDELEKQHRYDEAVRAYLEELRQHPTPRAYVGAGRDLARLGDYNRALPLLRRAVQLDPDNTQAHYSLAQVQFAHAEREWQQAPGSDEIKGWFREVIEHARRATELKPDHAMAYLFWGLSLKYLGEPAAAVAPLRQGVACRPELIEVQLALGEALSESGQKAEAETYLNNARRLDPNDSRPPDALKRLHKKQ
ncbi:MAG TPA: tetratricopeptide repeat protein [Gemmataceae bacterium]|nr:tetratricopeptide repeat protein [Gemmataceae bacterium]